ncbi:MAG: O-methyltransferase [Lachnospiraceae bacterium]|nr:O-methyltransferase [Lachnospiraceae bacterium]
MIVNDRIADYINSLEVELPEYLRIIEKDAISKHVPIVKRQTQSLLKFLVTMKQPENILEIGTAVGFSSLLMSEYMPKDCHITTIERNDKRYEKACENIKNANKEDQITIIKGDATEVLKDIGGCYDIVFVDAAKGQYLTFLKDVMPLMKSHALLISDNVLQDGDVTQSRYGVIRRNRTIHYRMRDYLYDITHMEEFQTVIIPVGDGVTLSTYKR